MLEEGFKARDQEWIVVPRRFDWNESWFFSKKLQHSQQSPIPRSPIPQHWENYDYIREQYPSNSVSCFSNSATSLAVVEKLGGSYLIEETMAL